MDVNFDLRKVVHSQLNGSENFFRQGLKSLVSHLDKHKHLKSSYFLKNTKQCRSKLGNYILEEFGESSEAPCIYFPCNEISFQFLTFYVSKNY